MVGRRLPIVAGLIDRGGMVAQLYTAVECVNAVYLNTVETQIFPVLDYEPEDAIQDEITLYGEMRISGYTVDWTLANTQVSSGLVTLTSSSSGFTENLDFVVNRENGTVTRLSSGLIPEGAEATITYDWSRPCKDVITGNPQPDCPTCAGLGYTYTNAGQVTGLFHIPTHDHAKYFPEGVFQTGDAIFTVLYKPNDTYVDGLPVSKIVARSKLIIDGQTWIAMTNTNTIQIGNEFLGGRLQLRMLTPDKWN